MSSSSFLCGSPVAGCDEGWETASCLLHSSLGVSHRLKTDRGQDGEVNREGKKKSLGRTSQRKRTTREVCVLQDTHADPAVFFFFSE